MPLTIKTDSRVIAPIQLVSDAAPQISRVAAKRVHFSDESSLPSVFEKYGVNWMKGDDGSEYLFLSPPIEIKAPIEKAWKIATDLNNYAQMSGNAVDAHIEENLEKGAEISLKIFPEKCVGQIMGTSTEQISVNDKEMKIVGWTRSLPLGGGDTERYHILVPIGPNLTRSYIGLKIPGLFGKVSSWLFKKTILKAFSQLHQGIKTKAEEIGDTDQRGTLVRTRHKSNLFNCSAV